MDDLTLFGLAKKLLDKARVDEINWKSSNGEELKGAYLIDFPESRFFIMYITPATELDKVNIWITNHAGKIVKDCYVFENENDPNWIIARDLYREADRYVTGWDQTLHDIEKELQKEGPVGLP